MNARHPPGLLCGPKLKRQPRSSRTVRGESPRRAITSRRPRTCGAGTHPSRSGTRAGGVGAWGGPSGCCPACKREGLPRELRGPAKCSLSSGPLSTSWWRPGRGISTTRRNSFSSTAGHWILPASAGLSGSSLRCWRTRLALRRSSVSCAPRDWNTRSSSAEGAGQGKKPPRG